MFDFNELSDENKVGLHLLSPYVGKVRPQLVRYLLSNFVEPGATIYDPFCGSGTIPLESWIAGYNCIATDLSDYAVTVTKGKLAPYNNLESALLKLDRIANSVKRTTVDISPPDWVSSFFHPDTLQEIISWVHCLKRNREWFLLSCLLGIIHHQRPGFLSYPSSHGAPYLRENKFPRNNFPELYEYRDVYSRLKRKVIRSYKNLPVLNFDLQRIVKKSASNTVKLSNNRINTIITSPPYMKSLTYARDNRLRLWFLGNDDWKALDDRISPSKAKFTDLITSSISNWKTFQKADDICIVIIGDIKYDRTTSLPEFIVSKFESSGYKHYTSIVDPIPFKRRFNKLGSKISDECIIVFKRSA